MSGSGRGGVGDRRGVGGGGRLEWGRLYLACHEEHAALEGSCLEGNPDGEDERAGIIVHRCAMLGAVHGFTGCNSTWHPGTNSSPDRNKHIRAVASKNRN